MAERTPRQHTAAGAAFVVTFLVAFLVAYALVGPINSSPVGYDAAASVLYFQRLVHGVLLEQPFGATPKPLLTLVDGLLYAAGGWPAISLVTVTSFAAVVALGSELARRLAGPVAGAFAFVALLGSRALLLDASLAYAVSWAVIGLLVAAFAVTGTRPRYVIAGIALGLATLARLETVVVVIGALLVVAFVRFGPGLTDRRPPKGAWWLAIALAAFPIMFVHDWLLVGDPLYWVGVSARFSARNRDAVMAPIALVWWLGRHYASTILMTILAVGGGLIMVRRRQWAIATGFALLGLGVPAFLLVLAARGTYVSPRYVALIDLGLIVAAAFGASAVSLPEFASRPGEATIVRCGRSAAGLAMVAAIAVAASVPFAPTDGATRRTVFDQRTVARNVETVVPILRAGRAAAGSIPGIETLVIAPNLWQPRVVVDLGLKIPEVQPARVAVDGATFLPGAFAPGQLVYHDRIGDQGQTAFAPLESGGSVDVDGVRLVPVASDPVAGWWVLRVEARP